MAQGSQSSYQDIKIIVDYLKKHKLAKSFLKKPDKKIDPKYYEVIRHPISINDIYQHLVVMKDFKTVGQVKKALDRVWDNYKSLNNEEDEDYKSAVYLEKKTNLSFKNFDLKKKIEYPMVSPSKSRKGSVDSKARSVNLISREDDIMSQLSVSSYRSNSPSNLRSKHSPSLTKSYLDHLDVRGSQRRGPSSSKSLISSVSSRKSSRGDGYSKSSPKRKNMTNKRVSASSKREKYDYSNEVFFSVYHHFFSEEFPNFDQDLRENILNYLIDKYPSRLEHNHLTMSYSLLAEIDKKFNLKLFRGYPVG